MTNRCYDESRYFTVLHVVRRALRAVVPIVASAVVSAACGSTSSDANRSGAGGDTGTPPDGSAAAAGSDTGGSGGGGTDARVDAALDDAAGLQDGASDGAGGSASDGRPPGDPSQCEVASTCIDGSLPRRDMACVDRQSGEREECDGESDVVDLGLRCLTSCTTSDECPPCSPHCVTVLEDLYVSMAGGTCLRMRSLCVPPGHNPGCYPDE